MDKEKLRETLEMIKKANEDKENLTTKYEEAKEEYGENTGISKVLNTNLEKERQKVEKLKIYTDDLVNEKNKIELEIKELEERRKIAKKEGRNMLSLIEKDEKNNVAKTDKIQENRMKKAKELGKEVLELNSKISEKSNLLEEIKSSLEILGYKEPEKEQKEDKEEKEQKEVKEQKIEKKSEVEIYKDKLIREGNEIIHDIATDYKNIHLIEIDAEKSHNEEKNNTKQLSEEEQEALINETLEYIDNKGKVNKKENIFKIVLNKIKSFKIVGKIKTFFGNVKYGIAGITGKTKLIDKAQKIDFEINENIEEKTGKENDSKYSLGELLNNSANLSLAEKHAIADYANSYGEQEAIKRFRGELASSEIGLNVQEMLKEEKENEFKGRLNVNDEDGKIEEKAKEEINSRNVIDKMKAAAEKSIPTR